MKTLLVVTGLAGAWTAGLQAQADIHAGARVRLAIKAPRVYPQNPDTHTVALYGRALGVDGGTLLVESGRDTVPVPLDSVRGLRAVVGRRHPAPEFAVLGALVGLGVGAAVGLTTNQCPGGLFDFCYNAQPTTSRAAGAVIGLVVGSVLGALASQFFEVDRWRNLEPKRVRIVLAPAGRGGSMGATIAF